MPETKIKLSDLIDGQIETLDNYLRGLLQTSSCAGYSFYEPSVKKKSGGVVFKSKLGIRMMIEGEEIRVAARVKYERGIPQRNEGEYVTLDIDYIIDKGRDRGFRVSDQVNFVDHGNGTREDSQYKISTTKLIFNEVERMIQPIMADSLIPFM